MHFLRLGDMLKRRLEGLSDLHGGLQNWFNFFAFAKTTPEDKMPQLVENNPAVMTAYEELRRFSSNEEMRDLERRRRRFLEDQRIYEAAARDEGIAEGEARGIAKRDIEIARNLKRLGSNTDFIAQATGLARAEVERLD